VAFLVSKDGQELGPFTADQVNAQLSGGMLDPEDLCWTEGFEDWYPLNAVEGFVMPGTQVAPTTEAAPATAAATEVAPGGSVTGLVTADDATASGSRGRKKWFIGGGIAAVLMATGAFLVFGGAGLDGLCQELAEPHPEPALPQELEAKMLGIRGEMEKLVADDNKTEADRRLNNALNLLKTGS
jgi:hypothetical protein